MRFTNVGLTPAMDANGDGIYDWDRNGILVGKSDPRVTSSSKKPLHTIMSEISLKQGQHITMLLV